MRLVSAGGLLVQRIQDTALHVIGRLIGTGGLQRTASVATCLRVGEVNRSGRTDIEKAPPLRRISGHGLRILYEPPELLTAGLPGRCSADSLDLAADSLDPVTVRGSGGRGSCARSRRGPRPNRSGRVASRHIARGNSRRGDVQTIKDPAIRKIDMSIHMSHKVAAGAAGEEQPPGITLHPHILRNGILEHLILDEVGLGLEDTAATESPRRVLAEQPGISLLVVKPPQEPAGRFIPKLILAGGGSGGILGEHPTQEGRARGGRGPENDTRT